MEYDLIYNVVMADVDSNDYPDFCDAYILSAEYDGTPMTEEQLDEINNDFDYLQKMAFESFI